MINHLSIKDFAIIENIDVDLHPGLNIITGETGAGKSIIIEAISMALGARADTTMVRSGHDKSLIQLSADTKSSDDIVITREISSSGKSLSKINGKLLSLTELTEETSFLADIHGQYDHQSLLDKENHIHTIDSFGSEFITPAKESVASVYKEYSQVKSTLNSLLKQESDSKRELDFLRFEIDEINSINPMPGEDDELKEKVSILQNSEKIHDALSESYMILKDQSPAALDQLGNVLNLLKSLSNISEDLKTMDETISESYYKLDDLANSVRDYLDKMDYSKETLDESLSRLDTLDRLKSKYGGTIEGILLFRDESEVKLNDIENIDERKDELTAKVKDLRDDLVRESQNLSKLRKKASEELSGKVQNQLNELNFSDATFEVKFYEDEELENRFSTDGIDRVEFLLSANKGLPPLPLAKIASGGEMSRIMLALKSVIGDYDRIPTMIFDEIDSGISGVTATIVGEKLLKMSKTHQIICITHLPQIAAFANHHYVIKKSSDDDTTYTTITEIFDENRIGEIARLLGGKNITENTMKSARELITMSQNP